MITRNITAAVGAIALVVAIAGPANADPATIHGFCNVTNNGSCNDNGTNTPLGTSTEFGFSLTGSASSGPLTLAILIPNNDTSLPVSIGITGINGNPSGSASLFSTTAWTSNSQKLPDYLQINSKPANPLEAYLPTTQKLDSGATGFYVYQALLNPVSLPKNGAPYSSTDYEFDAISGLSLGSYIVGFFDTDTSAGATCATSGNTCIGTPPSASLLVNGTTTVPSVPEPGTLALFASALLGLGLIARRRGARVS